MNQENKTNINSPFRGLGVDLGARTDKSFLVPVQEIRDNKYDLSINRYKEVVYEEKSYAAPASIIAEIETLDSQRAELLKQLKEMLG